MLGLVEELTLEELNTIPAGFNNNIIWNLGHIMISTIGLCYVRSQADVSHTIPFAKLFGKGTRPGEPIDQQTVNEVKRLIVESITQIERDAASGLFDKVVPYSTDTYGHEMADIKEILTCTLAHDNMHLGIVKAQKAVVKQYMEKEKSYAGR